MALASSALDAAAVGSRILRTEDGVFLSTALSGTQQVDAGDDAELLPVGTILTKTGTGPTVISASVPIPGRINVPVRVSRTPTDAARVVTATLSTITDILADLTSWKDDFATPA